MEKSWGLKNDVSLCSHLSVADNLQEGDLAILCSHEKQMHPASLRDQGILKSSKKSDSIKYMKPSVLQDKETNFNCKIFDVETLTHFLRPVLFSIFQ